jgi:NADPH:quinone reductase-like Zn-dependent oxidoreductase
VPAVSATYTTALTAPHYGRPEVLEFARLALPALRPDQARIAVKAAGVNPVDARRLIGEIRYGETPLFLGTEFAGTIVEVGADAQWAVGDEVLGAGEAFTHATVIDVPLANLIRRPPSVPWVVAGSLAGASQTAVTILEELGPVSSLLVHGGAGGVGSVTIQLARQSGATVVATSSTVNHDYLRSLGAIPVEYGPGLVERIQNVHRPQFDASIDMAGTEEATDASISTVKPDGIRATIAVRSTSPLITPIWRRRDPSSVARVVTGIAAGTLTWEVSATYPFTDAASAYEAILEGHVRGKSVLTF